MENQLGYTTAISNTVSVTNFAPELADREGWMTQLKKWVRVEEQVLRTYDVEQLAQQPGTIQRRQMMLAAAGRVVTQTFLHPEYKLRDGVNHIRARATNHQEIFG